ncbi:hypothetical protein HanLR1_Chr11g0417451 [Helianthus annuus]|nr:hypothetical protein HanHA89_Chr11g0439681 [Helianthus annuus]KAJ0686679.1 hypothetical protein HanLR1_Chr11g0417451 [Helianthus annuus]
MRSVVVEVRDLCAIERIKPMLEEAGYAESPICYIGGLKVLIVFKEKRVAAEFIGRKEEVWDKVCSSEVLWEGQVINFDRLAWVQILGVPVQIRDNSLFDRIAGSIGKVVKKSDFSWIQSDNSCGWCCILVNSGKRVEEEIEVVWQGNSYKTWVSEFHCSEMGSLMECLSSTTFSSPVKSTRSINGGPVVVEEGEIREEIEGSPMSVGRRRFMYRWKLKGQVG